MDKEKLVINTLVFLDDLKEGIPQSIIIDKINDIGINNVEVRREFIKDFNKEILDIREKASRYNINLFYSVPELLFKEGKLRRKEIEDYFTEAYNMGCHYVKMNIGEVSELSMEDTKIIEELCKRYSIKLTIENDQTNKNGRCEKIQKFLIRNRELGGNISFTFDVGNWIFQEENPIKNAEVLKNFVTYVHLKNVDNNRKNTLLDEGILDLKKILEILPKDLPMAIEYPCVSIDEVQREISKALKL